MPVLTIILAYGRLTSQVPFPKVSMVTVPLTDYGFDLNIYIIQKKTFGRGMNPVIVLSVYGNTS